MEKKLWKGIAIMSNVKVTLGARTGSEFKSDHSNYCITIKLLRDKIKNHFLFLRFVRVDIDVIFCTYHVL